MSEFTSVAVTRIAVTNASASVSLANLALFQIVDKSGNSPVDGSVARRRPNVLRMTYLPTAGGNVAFFRTGAAASIGAAVATTDAPILASWPLQRVLRQFEDTIAAIAPGAGDTGTLVIELGYGDAV